MKLDLMLSDTAVSQNEPAKELTRLLKLGLLPTDAVVSQRKASKELSQLMRLDLMLSDTAVPLRQGLDITFLIAYLCVERSVRH